MENNSTREARSRFRQRAGDLIPNDSSGPPPFPSFSTRYRQYRASSPQPPPAYEPPHALRVANPDPQTTNDLPTPPPQASTARGLAFIEPLILAPSGWKTAAIYRDATANTLRTYKTLISHTSTRTKQLKLLKITEDMTASYEKLIERVLETVCYDARQFAPPRGGETKDVEVQDVQVIWTGCEWGGASDGSWFTSLGGLKKEELVLYLEKMEEREWKDRLAVVFRFRDQE